jgi:hypothetical protein
MMTLGELKDNRKLVNLIDWTMTPEKAIEMYLEWGTGWIRGNDFVSSNDQESYYFVVYDWLDPQVTLIRRSMAGAEEIASIAVPQELFQEAVEEDGYHPGVGVHALNLPLKKWVSDTIHGAL